MNKKLILTGFAIFISLIFLMAPIGAASHSISPAATSSVNYQPNPQLNTQATWSTFNSSMAYNEYLNSTGKPAYLNVENGTGNYISINPSDIQSKYLQNDNISSLGTWENIAWTRGTGGGIVQTQGKSGNEIYETTNENSTQTSYAYMYYKIPTADLLSNSPAYDYITTIYGIQGTPQTGVMGQIQILNSTEASYTIQSIYPSNTGYISINLAQIEKESGYTIGLNTSGAGSTQYLKIQFSILVPQSTADNTYNLTVYGMALTQYAITIGSNSTGIQVNNGIGNIYLSKFSPAIPMAISNSGYSENLTQPLSVVNYTTTQTPITSGNYIEQVGYQATFRLPSAPDISYGAANFTLPLSVPADQFQALDVNGVSYLSTIGNKTNGTVVLLSSVDPTSSISYLAYVDFTPSQWQSISHPAGIFTIAGIEYYWFIAVGAIAGLLGLAGGVRHAHNKAEQTEKINRGGR
jgi:hypothetical protein